MIGLKYLELQGLIHNSQQLHYEKKQELLESIIIRIISG